MAQLERDELRPGFVCQLDQTMLSRDPAVLHTYPQKSAELRPYVCVTVSGEQSIWALLTSTFRRERLEIKGQWRHGGIDMWRDRVCYLNEGANTYTGPNASFLAASVQELTNRTTRSQISAEGVATVAAEIERQRKRRINGKDA